MVLALVVLGGLAAYSIPIDILPVFKSPAVQTLVFYSGMPAASIEKNITARLERGVGQASGGRRLESRSIVGISIVRDYFRSNVDRSGALTEVNSLAGWEYPTMPPGTLPPVVLPYDPTSATPVCLVALDSSTQNEATLFDVGRYEVRPQIMSQPGAIAPLVYGGKVRAIMMYLDRVKLQARHLSPLDVMKAVDDYNVFLPTGSAKFGTTDYAIDSNSMFDVGRADGRDPAAQRARQRRVPPRRGDAQGRQLHPDQRRAGQRQAPGLRPGLPPARRQHARRGRHPQGGDRQRSRRG